MRGRIRTTPGEEQLKPDFEIRVGGYYVSAAHNGYLIRKVVGEFIFEGRTLLMWESYNTDTGVATRDSGACSDGAIHDWAGREATPEEISRLTKPFPTRKEEASEQILKDAKARALETLNDFELWQECVRRGWKVEMPLDEDRSKPN